MCSIRRPISAASASESAQHDCAPLLPEPAQCLQDGDRILCHLFGCVRTDRPAHKHSHRRAKGSRRLSHLFGSAYPIDLYVSILTEGQKAPEALNFFQRAYPIDFYTGSQKEAIISKKAGVCHRISWQTLGHVCLNRPVQPDTGVRQRHH